MLDAWWLFAVVVALYLHDCVLWHRRGQSIFFGTPGRCRAADEPALTIGASGGASFLDPLPPLATAFRVEGTDLSLASARSRLDEWRSATLPLRLACNLLFVVLFAGAFVLCWFDAWAAWWQVWVAAGVPLWLATILLTAAATAELGDVSFVKGLQHSVALIASPMTAVRALDRTSERLLIDRHPLVAAYLLCREEEFARLVRREWFAAGGRDDDARKALRRFVREVKREKILTDTPVLEAGARSFCPACWAQYTTVGIDCKDCGVAVSAFDARSHENHLDHENHVSDESHERHETHEGHEKHEVRKAKS